MPISRTGPRHASDAVHWRCLQSPSVEQSSLLACAQGNQEAVKRPFPHDYRHQKEVLQIPTALDGQKISRQSKLCQQIAPGTLTTGGPPSQPAASRRDFCSRICFITGLHLVGRNSGSGPGDAREGRPDMEIRPTGVRVNRSKGQASKRKIGGGCLSWFSLFCLSAVRGALRRAGYFPATMHRWRDDGTRSVTAR